MVREIIKIDEDLCNGCGDCVPGCPEGALQIIDGKARLVGDLLCDGLGACIGQCPTGALTTEHREAEPYDEGRVIGNMIALGANTVLAHLEHLRDHQETENMQIALDAIRNSDWEAREVVLDEWRERITAPAGGSHAAHHGHHAHSGHAAHGGHGAHGGGCPGSMSQSFSPAEREAAGVQRVVAAMESQPAPSALTHWPVQMHLMNPGAPHFAGSDFVLAADCTAFSFGGFHKDFLHGKTLGIACPKLDQGQEMYVDKVRSLIDDAQINTLTVVIMQVPCCGGLLQIAQAAVSQASRKVPVKRVVVGIQGEVLDESWV